MGMKSFDGVFQNHTTVHLHMHLTLYLAIDNCNAFHEKATGIAAERKMNNLTRSRYTELLELLEISQLMDTTVRNGYYDEALELIEFARKLGKIIKLTMFKLGSRR